MGVKHPPDHTKALLESPETQMCDYLSGFGFGDVKRTTARIILPSNLRKENTRCPDLGDRTEIALPHTEKPAG
jgi:hypothetical protein